MGFWERESAHKTSQRIDRREWPKASLRQERFDLLNYITAATVCELRQQIAARDFAEPVTLVLDNARYQRGAWSKTSRRAWKSNCCS